MVNHAGGFKEREKRSWWSQAAEERALTEVGKERANIPEGLAPMLLANRSPSIWKIGSFFFFLFRVALTAYGGSQARGPVGAILPPQQHQIHATSFFFLPQLTAMLDP